MPLTKDYYRYQLDGIFNLSVSTSCNVLTVVLSNAGSSVSGRSESGLSGKKNRRQNGVECVVFGFAEYACLWDVRKNTVITRLKAANAEVRQIAVDSKNEFLALGYADGTVAAFQLATEELLFASKSHKTAVSALAFTDEGSMLASGSLDCQIMFWDLVTRTGICRVKGHTGSITQLKFVRLSATQVFLVSSSRDTTLRIWDITSYRCCATITGHVSDVNSFVFLPEPECMLITTSNDLELRCFRLDATTDALENEHAADAESMPVPKILKSGDTLFNNRSGDDDDPYSPVAWTYLGSVLRQQQQTENFADRKPKRAGASLLTISHQLTGSDSYVMVLLNNHNQQVEQYAVLCGKELDKRLKKINKKRAGVENIDDADGTLDDASGNKKRQNAETYSVPTLTSSELVEARIRPGAKLQFHYDAPVYSRPVVADAVDADDRRPTAVKKIFQLCFTTNTKSPSLLLVHHNSFYFAPIHIKTLEISTDNGLSNRSLPGHETDVRAVTFSRDGQLIASGSAHSLRVWNIDSLQQPLAVAASPALVACSFLHESNRYVLVGTKDGQLLTFDVRACSFIDSVDEAHAGPIWSICMVPNSTDFYTAGEDKQIRLWRANFGGKNGSLSFPYDTRKTYVVEDAITDLKMSPNGKFLAFSLLDNTVRIHFADSFKFFLSLYGHSLPVLTLDISYDSKLIITGSADKNVKIWGMDFGDCHKSLFAHDERVTSVRFVPNTHLFFSAGRDGKVKQWDADKFVRIASLPDTHFAEVWCMAVYTAPSAPASVAALAGGEADAGADFSPTTVITAGHDKTIRLWTQSEELLVLDEEQRLEREKEQLEDGPNANEEVLIVGEQQRDELGVVEPRSLDTMDAADRLVDAIGIYEAEVLNRNEQKLTDGRKLPPPPPQNAILRALGNISAEQYFLDCLRNIRPHNVQTALLSLPSDCVAKAAKILLSLLAAFSGSDAAAVSIKKVALNDWDLIMRALISLMRLNAMQIVASGRRGQTQADETGNGATLSIQDLEHIRTYALNITRDYKHIVASNTAALRSARQQLELVADEENVFADAMDLYKQKEQRKKRKQRAALTVAIQ